MFEIDVHFFLYFFLFIYLFNFFFGGGMFKIEVCFIFFWRGGVTLAANQHYSQTITTE